MEGNSEAGQLSWGQGAGEEEGPREGKLLGWGGAGGLSLWCLCSNTNCSRVGDVREAHKSTSEDRTIRRPRVL